MNEISLMPEEQYQRLQQRNAEGVKELWDLLDAVKDPEVPVLTIWDLGILRDIEREGDKVIVTITPTYSGCPAMDMITANIKAALAQNSIFDVEIKLSLSPAWTTEMISDKGRKRLKDFGIAPPVEGISKKEWLEGTATIECPLCDSENTEMISQFGSTACKALYRCNDCQEPFDYFKCL